MVEIEEEGQKNGPKVMVSEILENVRISSEKEDDLNGNFLGKEKKKSLKVKNELRNFGKLGIH